MGDALVRTALLATVVTAIVVTVSVLAGYALVWLGTPGLGGTAVVMLLAAAVIPVQVVVLPVSEVLNRAGISPVLTLILIHVAVGVPFTVLVFRWSFARVPADQVRRARLLSGGEWTVLRRVVLPMARPSLIALAALEFIQVWNDLVVSLLVGAPEVLPIGPVLLSQARQFTSGSGVLAAGSVIASLALAAVVAGSGSDATRRCSGFPAGAAGGAGPGCAGEDTVWSFVERCEGASLARCRHRRSGGHHPMGQWAPSGPR
jgi:ABC-type glycerol-3-phosphate transport system permease component